MAKGTPQPAAPRYCCMPIMPNRTFDKAVSADRQRLIVQNSVRWPNGKVLTYYFCNPSKDGFAKKYAPRKGSTAIVRNAFAAWEAIGIGIAFKQVSNKNLADIRIGFDDSDGAWSYLGREIIENITDKRQITMNLGWDELDTAIHEIGHTIGFPHEHQNPIAGIVWNVPAVIKHLGGPPNNWSEAETRSNIIDKIAPDAVQGSKHDANSVMHYPFGPGMILQPEKYRSGISPAGGLSSRDKQWVKTIYPPLKNTLPILKATQSAALVMKPGTQKLFAFEPAASKMYTAQTFGVMDSIVTVFQRKGTSTMQLAKDDDSGVDRNAKLSVKLNKGTQYLVHVLISSTSDTGSGSIMIF